VLHSATRTATGQRHHEHAAPRLLPDGRRAPPGPRPVEPARRLLRRVAFRVLVVLALLAAADWAVRVAFPPESLLPWMDREFAAYTVKVDRFRAAPAPDLLFLGNSRVHDGVVPEGLRAGPSTSAGSAAPTIRRASTTSA